jgi:hypothetical protein
MNPRLALEVLPITMPPKKVAKGRGRATGMKSVYWNGTLHTTHASRANRQRATEKAAALKKAVQDAKDAAEDLSREGRRVTGLRRREPPPLQITKA